MVLLQSDPMAPRRRATFESHTTDELVWIHQGRAIVSTASRTLIATADVAVYLPAGHGHGVQLAPGTRVQPLFLPCAHRLGPEVLRIRRTAGLDEAAAAALNGSSLDALPAALNRLVAELVAADRSETPPWPSDPRAATVARALQRDPADRSTLGEHAARIGVSERTLQRAFMQDTGLTFSQWRAGHRLAEGARRLRAGEPVATAARAAGYTPSAFIARYRAKHGTTPGRDAGSGTRAGAQDAGRRDAATRNAGALTVDAGRDTPEARHAASGTPRTPVQTRRRAPGIRDASQGLKPGIKLGSTQARTPAPTR